MENKIYIYICILIIILFYPKIGLSQDFNPEYQLRCDEHANIIYWTSQPSINPDACRYLIDDICNGHNFKSTEIISNKKYKELMHFFYEYGSVLTADKINKLCSDNKKVLK